MVNIDTHRVIDLLPSRETEEVAQWLKTYPKIEIVSRDGSASYKSAITKANEDIIQISDRFHLLKGLTDAAKKHIIGIAAANIWLPTSEPDNEAKEAADYWKKETKADFPTREHKRNYEKKKEIVRNVLELIKQGLKRAKKAEILGISYSTVCRYQSPDFNPINAKYNTTQNSKIKPYTKKIKQMLNTGNTFKEIEEEIRKDGYNGAASTIRMYAARERKLMKEAKKEQEAKTEKIERKSLISLLYKPIDKVKNITQEQLDKVLEIYPVIRHIYESVKAFKVFFQKNLKSWKSGCQMHKGLVLKQSIVLSMAYLGI